MAQQAGNKSKKQKRFFIRKVQFSRLAVAHVIERFLFSIIVTVSIATVLGSLFLTLQHIQATLDAAESTPKDSRSMEAQRDALVEKHNMKLQLEDHTFENTTNLFSGE